MPPQSGACARPPRRPRAAAAAPPAAMPRRELASFSSASPTERFAAPTGCPLIGLVTGNYASQDGTISLSLLAEEISPIGPW